MMIDAWMHEKMNSNCQVEEDEHPESDIYVKGIQKKTA